MRTLVVTSREKGHVHPIVGVAQELALRRHEVGWCFLPSPPEGVELLGARIIDIARSDVAPGVTPDVTHGAELAALLRDPPRLRAWIRALLIDGAEPLIAPARDAIRRFDPDVVAPDPMLYGAILAAHLEGRPWTSLSSSLNPVTPRNFDCELARTVRTLADAREALFARYDLQARFSVCDALSPWLTAVFASPRYAGLLGPIPSGVRALGPSRPRGPRGASGTHIEPGGAPIVYASFGSQAYHQPSRFETLIAATRGLGVRLVLAAGALAPALRALRAPHVEAHALVDQLAVLRHARLCVTHGGANSVMEALDAGVPLLVAPIANDQPIQAAFVEAAGTGRAIDLDGASAGEAREAIGALLRAEAPERRAAAAIARENAALDGARAAAEAIIALGERG
ncbi:MAG: glycosyltransferase family 1 protein [Sandaracinaceae bacterium]|nr:glycosyltransferase family 1 protein [Sandaracinaceae bacterium]